MRGGLMRDWFKTQLLSRGKRMLVILLTLIFGTGAVCGWCLVAFGTENGIYGKASLGQILERDRKSVQHTYHAMIFDTFDEPDKFADTNLCFLIAKGKMPYWDGLAYLYGTQSSSNLFEAYTLRERYCDHIGSFPGYVCRYREGILDSMVYQGGIEAKEADRDVSEATYWIFSKVQEPLDLTKDDLFVKHQKVITVLYAYRYEVLLGGVLCSLLFLAGLLFLLGSIFLSVRQGKYILAVRHRIPLLFYLLFMGGIEIYLWNGMTLYLGRAFGETTLEGAGQLLCITVSILALGIWAGILLLMNVWTRFWGGCLQRYTVCYYLSLFWHRKAKRYVEKGLRFIHQYISVEIRIAFVVLIFSFVEVAVIVGTGDSVKLELIVWGLYKVLQVACLLAVLLQMLRLQISVKKLAEGDLSYKTDTKHMLWDLKRHGEYLNQLGDGLELAVEERMKSDRFRTELITNVSHDIKTPLTSIINYVDLLQRDSVTREEQEEYLEVLGRQSIRLKKLIEDLIEASKAATGNLTVFFEDCNMEILLTQLAGEFEERLQERGMVIVMRKAEEEVTLQTDVRHLWRVFDNLMNNICKYGQPGTRVYISEEVTEEQVQIIFRNTSKYEIDVTGEELLERFVRGDRSRNTEGSGLGLSISQNLLLLMKGSLEIVVDGDLFKALVTLPR